MDDGPLRTRALRALRILAALGGAIATLAIVLALALLFADWNALKEPLARFASASTGRRIEIAGTLALRPFSLTPTVEATGLRIGNAAPFEARPPIAVIGRARIALRLLPLVIGRLEIVRLDLDGVALALYADKNGNANWAPARRADRPDLPPVRAFSVRNGQLTLHDERRGIDLDALFSTGGDAGRFTLSGAGQMNARRFVLRFSGAPLAQVRRTRPYPFAFDVTAGATRILANGVIPRPFNLASWNADVRASGEDLARLHDLTGLALPNTPPYRLSGRIARNGDRFTMPHLAGRVGDSDLAGSFSAFRQRDGRLRLDGDFLSRDLDFDDLLAVLGGPPSTAARETASPAQRAEARALAAEGRILSDARLDVARVRHMDARVTYHAARVRSEHVPLRGVSTVVSLDHGVVRLDPLALELKRGALRGAISIDARDATPVTELDMRLSGARLEDYLETQKGSPLSGLLLGRAHLKGAGASVRDAAAAANGQITFVTPRGEVREAFAELTGINVSRGLGLLLTGDRRTIAVRCGVASFDVRNGTAQARTILLDTETMRIGGGGRFSLRDESLALRIRGEPKEPRLLRVAAPIAIGGRLRAPTLGIAAADAADQGGIAAALASLVAPVAALLPFVDAGLAKDADCRAVLGRKT